ncbi:MAG TPA: methionine--tRNA ligase subunit beta, partial [Thermoanaerobaculia bacterium]|nr:methionine--tRNA ligase subunit beta [Thermoanaerobaculia bacterium]
LSEVGQYLVANEPWKMIRTEELRGDLAQVLRESMEAVRVAAIMLLPVMPQLAPKVLRALGVAEVPGDFTQLAWGGLPADVALPASEPLFPRIDKEAFLSASKDTSVCQASAGTPSAAASTPSKDTDNEETNVISIEKFFETELKIGTVVAAEAIEKSNKLLHLTVDLGEAEHRSLVAGIAKEYAPADLIGKQVVVVANLEPAKLMGVASQGMVLAASVEGRPVLLHPAASVPAGTSVR